MAKRSMVCRELKRQKAEKKYRKVRDDLRAQLKDPSLGFEEKMSIQRKFENLPRDSNRNRQRNRCPLSGRPHGVYGKRFNLGRNKLREHVMQGDCPGTTKASW